MRTVSNSHRSSLTRSLSAIHLRTAKVGVNSSISKSDSSSQRISIPTAMMNCLERMNSRGNSDDLPRLPFTVSIRGSSSSQKNSATSSQQSTSPTSITANIENLPRLPFNRNGNRSDSSRTLDANDATFKCTKMLQRRRRVYFAKDIESEGGTDELPQKKGLRKDYVLGDPVRSPTHMILDSSVDRSLKKHDFAFIKRSDGKFTYAILAGHEIRTKKNCKKAIELCMIFVIDGSGKHKMIRQSDWSASIRLVCPEGIVNNTV